jgi:hypothetical protein
MAVSLTDVETAISAIQDGGQSFTVDGFTYNAGNLDALLRLREKLLQERDAQNNSRPLFRAFNFTSAGY